MCPQRERKLTQSMFDTLLVQSQQHRLYPRRMGDAVQFNFHAKPQHGPQAS
jgi:hypothetical protein